MTVLYGLFKNSVCKVALDTWCKIRNMQSSLRIQVMSRLTRNKIEHIIATKKENKTCNRIVI